jgi:fructokinase
LLGVDVGGTKIEAVVVRAPDGAATPEVVARLRVPTDRDRGYDHVVQTVASVIAEVARRAQLATLPPIGVGMPGNVSRSGLVKNSNTTCLNGRPFRQDLARHVGAPISFANDANCFAVAEATWGAGRGARVVFGVILGTGVGGGVVLDGRGWDGAQGIAGEWGHVTLEPDTGPTCYCGRRGCVEQFLCGPAIERAYAARIGSEERTPLPTIVERAAVDEAARATIADVVRRFGRAIATVINVLDPDVVVLGGGVSNASFLYDEGVAEIGRWVFNDELRTRVVKHAIGDSAGVLGAALLGWHGRAG